MHTGTQEKEQWPCKKLTQTCLWVSRSLWRRCGSAMACCRVRSIECSSACIGPFEGGQLYRHYLYHSLASGQITGREHSLPIPHKIGLKIYWAQHIKTRPSFLLSQSLLSGSFLKPLILLYQRTDRLKTESNCLTFVTPLTACITPVLPVDHQLPEFTQTHVHWVGDAIQLSHPLSSPSPLTFNLTQHQGLFKWVSSSHHVAKVLEFQL